MMHRIKLALAISLSGMTGAGLADQKIGQTFPVVEPDVLQEIQTKAGQKDWRSWMKKAPMDGTAYQSEHLPVAQEDKSRLFDPTYAIPFDIPDGKGNIRYPKGYKVNVYDKITMPGRFIAIGDLPAHYEWLDKVAKPSAADKVLLAGGHVLNARKKHKRNIYVLDERMIERFGLEAVPAIVEQEGNMLRVTEYAID